MLVATEEFFSVMHSCCCLIGLGLGPGLGLNVLILFPTLFLVGKNVKNMIDDVR